MFEVTYFEEIINDFFCVCVCFAVIVVFQPMNSTCQTKLNLYQYSMSAKILWIAETPCVV